MVNVTLKSRIVKRSPTPSHLAENDLITRDSPVAAIVYLKDLEDIFRDDHSTQEMRSVRLNSTLVTVLKDDSSKNEADSIDVRIRCVLGQVKNFRSYLPHSGLNQNGQEHW